MPRLTTIRPTIRTLDQRTAKEPVKVKAQFYDTPEYRAWRAAVIARAGGRCQDPACRAQVGGKLYADHIVELRDGGAPLDLANGMARCASCHGAKTLAERAKRMARRY